MTSAPAPDSSSTDSGPASQSSPLDSAARAAAMTESIAGGLGLVTALLQSVGGDSRDSDTGARAVRTILAAVSPALMSVDHDAATTECRSCPVCRLLALARVASPELVDALGDGLDAILRALTDSVSPSAEGETWA